ncbi:MAG TPA: P-loop NTPase [Solirubrobacteraceae bacterium]|jgi:Mrp family chromosome partitioning ATPase|nr:P-loop NTPase [Solirubrobacteraceae bacterium]
MLVVAITLLTVAAAGAWLASRSSTYQATAEILITPLPQDYPPLQGLPLVHDANDETRTAQTAATLVDSPAAAELTAARIDHGYTRAGVQQAITVDPQGQSNILAITASASSPSRAANLANTFAHASLDARRQVVSRAVAAALVGAGADTSQAGRARLSALLQLRNGQDPTLSLSQTALAPTSATGTPKWLVILLAVVAGFTIGSGVALLMEFLNQRIREPEELLGVYPMPVLARVPKLPRRLRRREGERALTMPPSVREAFRSLHVQLEEAPGSHRVIVLTSASSGDGKTSSALNLALALVAAGNRVVLMDFDLRKPDLGRVLGLQASRGLVSLLGSDRTLSDVLLSAPGLPPLSVAPAGTGEGDVLLLGALARRLPAIMSEARELADYIIVDTPPLGEVSDALRVLPEADDILVVARPGNTNRPSLELMRDLLARAGQSPFGMVMVGTRGRGAAPYYAYGVPPGARSGARSSLARALSR